MSSKKNRVFVQFSLLVAIQIVLTATPLGYLPLNVVDITTMHIPVIIGAILLGPLYGGMLGGVFGLTSMLVATFRPSVVAGFVFSPFINGGNFGSVLIAFVPRILIGVIAAYLFIFLSKHNKNKVVAIGVSAFVATIVNTTLVLGGIYLFFKDDYSNAVGILINELLGFFFSIIAVNGVIEAVVAVIVSIAICKPLLIYLKRYSR